MLSSLKRPTIIMLMDTQNSFVGQAPTSTPEPQTFNNYDQPKKKSATPIIIALVILVLALGGVTAFLLLNNNSSKNDTTASKEDKGEETETEISSETVKKDLFNKMKYIIGESYNDEFNFPDNILAVSGYDFPFELFKNGTHTDAMKLQTAANSFNGKLSRFYSSDKGKNYAKAIYNKHANTENFKYSYKSLDELENDYQYAGYIEAATLNERYKSIYGEDIKTHGATGICGELLYDSSLNIYYTFSGASQCGGASPDVVNFYIDSYSSKGNEAYIDVYSVDSLPEGANDNNTCQIWSLDNSNNSRACSADEAKILNGESPYAKSFITESNKDTYDHYRFVFSGENNDYHFVKVEKVAKK